MFTGIMDVRSNVLLELNMIPSVEHAKTYVQDKKLMSMESVNVSSPWSKSMVFVPVVQQIQSTIQILKNVTANLDINILMDNAFCNALLDNSMIQFSKCAE